MESPNAEYRGFESRPEIDNQRSAEQYRSMRELLKMYGVNVTETTPLADNKISNIEKATATTTEDSTAEDDIITSPHLLPPPHPSDLLRSTFSEQLSNKWLEMYRNNSRLSLANNSVSANLQQQLPSSNIANPNPTHSTGRIVEEMSSVLPENLLKRFESAGECGEIDCILQQLRDHYHCEDRYCVRDQLDGTLTTTGRRYLKTFSKKEDIVRHCKWHKKRAETLKFGFLRFSCMDDCQLNGFGGDCQFNGKQTHYHCIEADCDKVYISTSDVQMHANYHRKTNAIKMQGFLRVRNLETCQEPACPYANHQTTHFHCLRDGCQFTFKNKGEMEKHKVYHMKDEQLLSDGFKKFFKSDKCKFPNCRYDGKLNHIHCIRPSCNYVFHSSGQLTSHKRKHEKLAQGRDASANLSDCDASSVSTENNLLDLSLGAATCGSGVEKPLNSICFTSPSVEAPLAAGHHLQLLHAPAMGTPMGSHSNNVLQITSIDGLFNRKRGRPPKNRFVEVYNTNVARTSYSPDQIHNSLSADSPQAIFASFKLDKSVTGSMNAESEGSRENIKKKPKLMGYCEGEEVAAEALEKKPVLSLIKSKGIFFPNAAAAVSLNTSQDCESSSSDSISICEKRLDTVAASVMHKEVTRGRDENGQEEEEEEDESDEGAFAKEHNNGNGKADPFRGNPLNQHIFPQPNHTPFVPSAFPVNMTAVEHNNGMPNFGMEWLKYAYQQANNPLMMFAATAALLAASMNPMETTTPMDPGVVEYAKNMFLYNNFQQLATQHQQDGVAADGSGISENRDSSLLHPSTAAMDYSQGVSNFSKDEAIPSGYLKFRFNEDCRFTTCGYRNHQSHFHCLRDNCYYSFCDKTRFVQHTARHERLDKLMGSDFKQFRSNMNCGYEDCEYVQQQQQSRLAEEDETVSSGGNGGGGKGRNASKSSHFHCQKCDYICTDTNKVVAHRRQHNKTDFIRLSGFRKVASSESCYNHDGGATMTTTSSNSSAEDDEGLPTKCHYSGKQTHYHCLVCHSVVLNRSQLAMHRHKGQPK